MQSYSSRRSYGDRSIENIKSIVAKAKHWNIDDLQIASDHLDMTQATDLIHIPSDERISVRVRTPKYIERYFGEFTIRTSGATSEWQKLQWQGSPYTMFYAFQDAEGRLLHWWLYSLDSAAFGDFVGDQTNGTDSSFKAFRFRWPFVVASSEPFPYTVAPNETAAMNDIAAA